MNEYLKEKISYYKLLLTFLVTAFYGTIGWYFGAGSTIALDMSVLIMAVGFVIIISIGAVIYKTRFYMEQLKEYTDD